MEHTSPQPSAGWYPDPAGSGTERYWDGASWSPVTRPSTRLDFPAFGGMGEVRLAGWWARFAAVIIDGLVLAIPGYLLIQLLAPGALEAIVAWFEQVSLVLASGRSQLPPEPTAAMDALQRAGLAQAAMGMLYRAVFVAWRGATPGKMVLRIRVVPAQQPTLERPETLKAVMRAVVQEVLSMGLLAFVGLISYLMPLFTARKQTLHDMVAGTIVVKTPTHRSPGDPFVR
ncbi:MAG: RDD family protein [Propionibacteriaceae bacterium]|nr:RDD family protein [Propionibacteriaceae bacterium]